MRINDFAFFGSSLRCIVLPESLISMGSNPFAGTIDLKLDIAEDHPVFYIADGALYNRKEKVLIAYPREREEAELIVMDGTKAIGNAAFYTCSKLNSIVLPEGLTTIGDDAFYMCSSLRSLVLPFSLTNIGRNPFIYCSNLETLHMAAGHPEFCMIDGALYNKREHTLIAYFMNIGGFEFAVVDATTAIADDALYGCSWLRSVTLPEGLIEIGEGAFSYCHFLSSVNIPTSVTKIGYDAFKDCNELKLIVGQGSYAQEYAKDNEIPYTYSDSYD